jgi:hypothetical protein
MEQGKKVRSTESRPQILSLLDSRIEALEKRLGKVPKRSQEELEASFRNQYRMSQSGKR